MADLTALTAPAGAQWGRQRDERPDEHAAFTQWLGLTPRPAPSECGPGVGELAARHDWLGRAQAYDAACELMRLVPDGSPSGLVRSAVEMWAQAVAIDAAKLARQAMASKAVVLDPAVQLSFLQKFLELGAQFARDTEELNADALTPEELNEYLRLTAKLEKK
jgi:hypothetical protein